MTCLPQAKHWDKLHGEEHKIIEVSTDYFIACITLGD